MHMQCSVLHGPIALDCAALGESGLWPLAMPDTDGGLVPAVDLCLTLPNAAILAPMPPRHPD